MRKIHIKAISSAHNRQSTPLNITTWLLNDTHNVIKVRINCCDTFHCLTLVKYSVINKNNIYTNLKLAEWRSGSVSALPCERPGFASRTRLMDIIPANNCTMQGQNNWGNWGSPGVMKLWVAWEVLRWLMKFRELCSGGFHPKLVTSPYHGFLNVNTPPHSQNSKRHEVQRNTQVPVGKHNNGQHASPHHEVATDVKQMPIRPIIFTRIVNIS